MTTVATGVTVRDGKYLAQVMIAGKRSAQTFDTKDAAVAWRAGRKVQHARGAKLAATGGTTLRRYWPDFIDTRDDPTTAAKNRTHWNRWIEPTWGGARMRDVQPADLDKWARDLVRVEGKSGAYVQCIVYTLSAMFTEAVHAKLIPSNPCRLMRYHPGAKAPMRVATILTDDHVDRVLRQARDDATYALVILMADTGARIGEAAAVTAADIHDTHIRLHQRVDRTTRVIKPGLKNGEPERKAPMTARLSAALAPVLKGKSGAQLLFTNTVGKSLDLHNFYSRTWWPMVDAAKLPQGMRPTPHDMRHTYATVAAQQFTQHELRDLIGHRDSRSLDRYLHAGSNLLERAAAASDARQAKRRKPARKRPTRLLQAV